MLKNVFFVTLLLVGNPVFAKIEVIDRITPFLQQYSQLKDHSLEIHKTFVLRNEFINAQAFNETYYGDISPDERDNLLKARLESTARELEKSVKLYKEKLEEVHAITDAVQASYLQQFNAELKFPLYLFSALVGTDGCIAEIDKGLGFALNFRRIQEYGNDELKIVIAHEFFHVYQNGLQKIENQGPRLERGIFTEGWATYVSSIINPGYPDWKYISYSKRDDQQYKEFQKYQKEIASEFLRLFTSDKYEDYRRFFNGDDQYAKPWPARSGYYIGYTIAKNLERKMKPKDIALMKYAEFQKIIKGELEILAK